MEKKIQYRIIEVTQAGSDTGFYVQRYSRRWFKWAWRNVQFLHGCIDTWMDYFPTYEDAKEGLDLLTKPPKVRVVRIPGWSAQQETMIG